MNPPKPQNSFFSQVFFVLSLLFLMVAVGGFFALYYMTNTLKSQYNGLNAQLTQEETADQKSLETTVLEYKQRLQDFSKVLNAHTAPSRFFASLEPLVYPTVYFDGMTLTPAAGTVEITGKVDTFESLADQVAIFKNATTVFKKIDLSKINLGSDGKIEFSFKADIMPDAILFK